MHVQYTVKPLLTCHLKTTQNVHLRGNSIIKQMSTGIQELVELETSGCLVKWEFGKSYLFFS